MLTRKKSEDIKAQKEAIECATTENNSDCPTSDSSEDSHSSLTDLPFNAKSWREVRKKLSSIAWVQCDNPECRKWRKIPSAALKGVSDTDKWFCSHNPDKAFSSCSVTEEDLQWYEQLADRSGLQYLKSDLAPGDLVWAKMNGYCSWPSIVTPDPVEDGEHVERYVDGDAASYHVEFLGQPHSHGWVRARNVSAFTPASVHQHKTQHQKADSREQCVRRGRGRRRLGPIPLAHKEKRQYSGVQVTQGVLEALELLPLAPHARLESCTYVSIQPSTVEELSTSLPAWPSSGSSAVRTKARAKRGRGAHSSGADNRTKAQGTPPHFTSFDSSLHNRTKEERLMLDVEMYKQNERAFVHDVTRFMLRNGLRHSKGPFWQNQTISLFTIFLTVHERGGYKQVTARKKWAAVYREVTESPSNKDVKNSTGARLFYYRHLYPYELYVRGEDFTAVVSELKRDTYGPAEKNMTNISQTPNHKKRKQSELKVEPCGNKDDVMETEAASTSDSMKEMLQALEEHSHLVPPVKLEKADSFNKGAASNSNSQGVFHQLENVNQPAQVVPSASNHVIGGDDNDMRDDDDNTSGSVSSNQMLQQLDNLGEKIHMIYAEMEGATAQDAINISDSESD